MDAVPVLLTTRQAADMFGLTEQTLAQWRMNRAHPLRFVRISRQIIRYRLSDVEAFLQSKMVCPVVAKKGKGRP